MAVAGTAEELQRAEEQAAQTHEKLTAKSDELVETIRKAQAELTDLQTAAVRASDEVARRLAARETLRDPSLLPEHIRAHYDQRRGFVAAEYRAPLLACESELKRLATLRSVRFVDHPRNLTGTDRAQVATQLAVLEGLPPDERPQTATEWQAFVAKECAREASLRAERDDLQRGYDLAMRELDELKNHYIDPVGLRVCR
jgi:hypothetical protein